MLFKEIEYGEKFMVGDFRYKRIEDVTSDCGFYRFNAICIDTLSLVYFSENDDIDKKE